MRFGGQILGSFLLLRFQRLHLLCVSCLFMSLGMCLLATSAYFNGGAIIYTMRARRELLGIERELLAQQEPLTTSYVSLCADRIRERLRATWGLAELGATGPAGTPYGHPPGICALAITGPDQRTHTLETGLADRERNMEIFTAQAFELLYETLSAHG